eukprot:scpid60338/ scgid30667/ 
MTDIVRGVMAEESLFTECVPNMYRIQDVFGTSRCFCARCSRVWTSHMTWVKFDLRSQRILKNWKQLCMVCSSTVNPYINSEELERMARLAVERCVALTSGTFVLRSSQRRNPPHNTMACEKCRDGGRPCWIIKQKKDGEEDSSSPCPSESGASSGSCSDIDAISNDFSQLVVNSADSSKANSRAPSPRNEEPSAPTLPTSAARPYVGGQFAYNQPGAVFYPPSHYASPVYYTSPAPVYQVQPTWYQQAPVYTGMPIANWY